MIPEPLLLPAAWMLSAVWFAALLRATERKREPVRSIPRLDVM